uniref:Putative secreted protein n=1 Tax=Anopheles darlingi TaxID=43151 RepID=A0A2M4D4P9_ANODA
MSWRGAASVCLFVYHLFVCFLLVFLCYTQITSILALFCERELWWWCNWTKSKLEFKIKLTNSIDSSNSNSSF